MKYIDADKLLAEIEQLNSLVPYENNDRHDDGLHDAYKAVKNVIASLQQEAAEEYRRESLKKSVMPPIDGPVSGYGGSITGAFIAGAKWQKGESKS